MIKVNGVAKRIKSKEIIKDISFEIYEGDVLGVVGPNGTGKSTLLSMLCDITRPSDGSIEFNIDGESYTGDKKKLIGYVPQSIALYNDLNVIDNFMLFGAPIFKDNKENRLQATKLIEKLHLIEQIKLPINRLSGGEKRRVNIGVALLKNPRYIFMDEPVVGVDYYARQDIEDIINALSKQKKIVVIVSHQIEFLEKVCNKLLILKEGKQVCFGDFYENVGQI